MTAVRDWWEDPDCPPLPDPPAAPHTAQLTCHVFHTGGFRLSVLRFLSPGMVPDHAALALNVALSTKGHAVDDVWLSFYRTNPDNPGHVIGDPYDFYVTHIPANSRMNIDGIRDAITLSKSGQTVDASHLVYRSNKGHVFRWPEIDCGGEWQLWVRVPTATPAGGLVTVATAAVKYA